jgi:thiamine biosynthesis lipoprotein ApbE
LKLADSRAAGGLFATQPRAQPAGLRRVDFHAMGTRCSIQFACADGEGARTFERRAVSWVQAFEAKYSRFQPDSLISRINDAAGIPNGVFGVRNPTKFAMPWDSSVDLGMTI